MRLDRAVLVVVLSVVTAAGATAMFRTSDLVVVPVAAATVGLQNSNWRTDVEIMNVDTEPVDVIIVFLPTGNVNNSSWYRNIENVLGGRTEDGFGHIDAKLKDIPAGRTVILEDIIRTPWGEGEKGALLVFGIKAATYKTTTPIGGEPRKIQVNSRSYSLSTNADSQPLTFGQSIPGLPWYYYIDPGKKSKNLDHVVFSGIQEDAFYRCAFGLVNLSDQLTWLNVQVVLKGPDGTVLGDVTDQLQPLAHTQWDKFLYNYFGLTADKTVKGGTLTISVKSYYSAAENPTPALLAYVSRIDNLTNDPVYLEQRFEPELPWDCVFNGNCGAASGGGQNQSTERPFRRPLDPPTPLAP
ncbi:MAG: hypothetical protein MUF10_19850 [Thermoanaerobaculaceae bacterium]|nr:hypothetical protein [Thermoanaerobaculaceae bacterium]